MRTRRQAASGFGRPILFALEWLARAARFWLKSGVFIRAVATCDAFIFAGGETFFRRRDLPLLRLLRKRVIVVFVGSDHRPPYLNGRWVRSISERDMTGLVGEIQVVHDRVRTTELYADVIVASGASAQFHRHPFVQILAVGTPIGFQSADVGARQGAWFSGRGVRILHSPSDPASKGTDEVRAAVAAVRADHHEIDYVELSGRPHSEVLSCLRECDLVIDEVYSDAPMGMFAAEAAFFAKPALVTGYYAEVAPTELPADLIPPTLFAMPDRLVPELLRIVADEGLRVDLGQRAQAFLRSNWEPGQVARRYLRPVTGDIPADWLCDPSTIRYLRGYGMPDDVRRQGIRRIIAEAGSDALCVMDSPDLQRRIRDEVADLSVK